MISNIEWLGHSTIKILDDKIIYIDPYNIKEEFNDADIIFITHNHYDHFSIEDIKKCMKNNTKIIVIMVQFPISFSHFFHPFILIFGIQGSHIRICVGEQIQCWQNTSFTPMLNKM